MAHNMCSHCDITYYVFMAVRLVEIRMSSNPRSCLLYALASASGRFVIGGPQQLHTSDFSCARHKARQSHRPEFHSCFIILFTSGSNHRV